MNHLAKIQVEFLKVARKWDDLTYDEQRGYLQRHPKTKRRLTARPDGQRTTEKPKIADLQPGDFVQDYNGHRLTVLDSSMNFNDVEKYDSTGVGDQIKDLGNNTMFVAVQDEDGTNLVYVYGESGVTKVKGLKPAMSNDLGELKSLVGSRAQRRKIKAQKQLSKGNVLAIKKNGQKKYLKLDEEGRLWSSKYENVAWTLDDSITLDDVKQGYEVIGPQLQPLQNTGNKYFTTLKPVVAWITTGFSPSNAYYGASRIHKADYSREILPVGTKVEILAGGDFIVSDKYGEMKTHGEKLAHVRFTDPAADPGMFEKQYGGPGPKMLPLSAMAEISAHGTPISGPKKLNLPKNIVNSSQSAFGPNLDDRKHELARLDAAEKVTENKQQTEQKKDFPTDEIIRSMKSLFRGQGERFEEPAADNDSVHLGIRELGQWNDRPGEEDDDYPEWDEASARKYITEFSQWAKRQPWFNPETMKASVTTSEKRWVEFYIEKKK